MEQYDIFISCKSEDYDIAEKVYSFLTNNGFSVFLASQELRKMAKADYMDAISIALDSAYSMIVVSSKKKYLTSEYVKFEWSTFLNEKLSGRKTGQIMTLLENIKVSELPIQLRKYESFTLENYENVLPYLEKPKKTAKKLKPKNGGKKDVNNSINDAAIGSEVHVKTDIPCRVLRFNKELMTAQPDVDNLIHLKKGSHEFKFVSIENEQDNYSQVYTIKDECEILQVNLTEIRDARLAKESERIAEEDFSPFREGLTRVEKNRKWGFIDKTGKVVIAFNYDDAKDFSEGLAAVKLNGKWGFIDKTDKVVIPFKYKDANQFSEGLAPVRFIDKNDWKKLVASTVLFTPLVYSSILLVGVWGYIDKTDKVIIPFKYVVAEPFSEGRAKVAKLNFKRGTIDKQGNFTPDE